MRVTSDFLRSQGVCERVVARFERQHPDGIELTDALCTLRSYGLVIVGALPYLFGDGDATLDDLVVDDLRAFDGDLTVAGDVVLNADLIVSAALVVGGSVSGSGQLFAGSINVGGSLSCYRAFYGTEVVCEEITAEVYKFDEAAPLCQHRFGE